MHCKLRIIEHRIQNTDYRLQIIDYRLQITDYRLQITDYRLQITDYRFQITDYRLQITDYSLQITEYRLQITDYRLHLKVLNHLKLWNKFRGLVSSLLFSQQLTLNPPSSPPNPPPLFLHQLLLYPSLPSKKFLSFLFFLLNDHLPRIKNKDWIEIKLLIRFITNWTFYEHFFWNKYHFVKSHSSWVKVLQITSGRTKTLVQGNLKM